PASPWRASTSFWSCAGSAGWAGRCLPRWPPRRWSTGPPPSDEAVSVLLMSETLGLLLGSAAGGWLYQGVGVGSPFLFEAACMIVAAATVARWASLTRNAAAPIRESPNRGSLGAVLRTRGVLLMGTINALLTAIQTGVLVFLFPLYLAKRGGLG